MCVIGDCVGGILGFDALCSSSVTVSESQNSSRRGSAISVQVSGLSDVDAPGAKASSRLAVEHIASVSVSQDTELLSPGIVINSVAPSLEGSRHLSRSNIDIPRCSGPDDPKRPLPRKRSDSSTYELDTIKHHQAFLSRCVRALALALALHTDIYLTKVWRKIKIRELSATNLCFF